MRNEFAEKLAVPCKMLSQRPAEKTESPKTLRCANDSFRDSPVAWTAKGMAGAGWDSACLGRQNAIAFRARNIRTRGNIKKECDREATFLGSRLTDAILLPAAYQRADAGIDLWADRNRLHDGLRHHRHDQFRPRRHIHDRRFRRADRLSDPDRHVLRRAGGHRAADHDDRRDAGHQPLQLGDREGRLPAVARLVPAGAADHRDRHVDRAFQFRAGRARAPQQADPADGFADL